MDHPPAAGNAWAMTSAAVHLHEESLNAGSIHNTANQQTEKIMRFEGEKISTNNE